MVISFVASCAIIMKNVERVINISKKNIVGQRFGKLVVLRLDEEKNNKQYERWENGELKNKPKPYYICECDCGNVISTLKDSLLSGATKSCGCIRRENTSKMFSKTNIYEDCGDYYKIWDYKHENFTTIDKEDYDLVKDYCWGRSREYWRTTINNKGISLHDFIMQKDMTDKLTVVDHIDRNPSNNRRDNLRIVTYSGNSQNLSVAKNNTSGVKGVGIAKDGFWRAYICVEGKSRYKYFLSFKEACYQRYLWEVKFGFILQDYFIINNFDLLENPIKPRKKKEKKIPQKKSKEEISNNKKGGRNPMARPLICGNLYFESIVDCATYYDVKINSLRDWLRGKIKMPQKFVDLGLRHATQKEIEEYQQGCSNYCRCFGRNEEN